MIRWLEHEEGEGRFNSAFFRNEEDDEFIVYVITEWPDYKECAEKCVEAFNALPPKAIDEICEKLIVCAQEGGIEEDFELPELEDPRDILNHCWFGVFYVDMAGKDDRPAYAVEGEGEWGENIGFVIDDDQVVYVGTDYLEHMKNAQ